jgi:hypothetical protein
MNKDLNIRLKLWKVDEEMTSRYRHNNDFLKRTPIAQGIGAKTDKWNGIKLKRKKKKRTSENQREQFPD